ncbi:MAG: sensor histidine kinase [Solirubrobacteraceae bacterium]
MLSGSELWLLRLMADRGRALLDADSVLVVIEESGELRVVATAGSGSVRLRIVPIEGTALGDLHSAGQPVALDRPRGRDAAWLQELGVQARGALSEPLPMHELGAGLVIALRESGSFREPDQRALAAFAESVARRLAAERSVEIERLRHGMQARERERARWAREIHDETVQGLGALRLKLASAREDDDGQGLAAAVEEALEGLGREIEGLRHMITELRPAALDDLGLEAAIQALARRAQAIDALEVHTQIELVTSSGDGRLDAELESTIYRVVQEALTNVSKHAKASSATIALVADERTASAWVSDDGEGMPEDGRRQRSPEEELQGGFGTSGMRERAELVGGELAFESRPGGGTTVRLTVPLAGRPAIAAPAG